jgi:hypothetical protein
MECDALNIIVGLHFTKFITPIISFTKPYSLHGNKFFKKIIYIFITQKLVGLWMKNGGL